MAEGLAAARKALTSPVGEPDVKGAVCADIGASIGGLTDCLLQEGAVRVHAIDVGYGQFHEKLCVDSRVISRERVNARHLTDEAPEAVDIVVIDVSFISLTQVLPSVLPKLKSGGADRAGEAAVRGRPRERGEGRVVGDTAARRDAVDRIRAFVGEHGLRVEGVVDSQIAGPAGNREALLVATRQ